MKRGRLQGSVSVFLAYVLVFVLAVLFLLLEVSRVWGLEQRAKNDVILMGNSLLAEYRTDLWDDYGLLLLDGTYGNGKFTLFNIEKRGAALAEENLDIHGGISGTITAQSWNLYGLHPTSVAVTAYGLATDKQGLAFQKEAVRIMENRFTEVALKELYELVQNQKKDNIPAVTVEETTKEITLSENPIDVVDGMKQGECLDYVSDFTTLSNKQIDLTQTLSKRELCQGNYSSLDTLDWKEKLLFRQYLKLYFACYVDAKKDHALDYEMEYLIAGKASDKDNLRAVVNRLLLLREAANLQYLQTDVTKQEIVLAAATAIGTATLTPELIPVYRQGLNGAWAYAESLSDVRLLLDGQKVNVIKTKDQWHTDLTNLTTQSSEIKQTKGLSYQEYLQILLWTLPDGSLSYRAMDLMEANTGCAMDTQIYHLEGSVVYQAEPLFSSLVSIGHGSKGCYHFRQNFCVSYIDD